MNYMYVVVCSTVSCLAVEQTWLVLAKTQQVFREHFVGYMTYTCIKYNAPVCISVHCYELFVCMTHSGKFQGTADSVDVSVPTLDLDSQDSSLLDSTTTSVTSVSSVCFKPSHLLTTMKTVNIQQRGFRGNALLLHVYQPNLCMYAWGKSTKHIMRVWSI